MSKRAFIFSVVGPEYLEDGEMEDVIKLIEDVLPGNVELLDIEYTQDNTFEVLVDLPNEKQSTIDNVIEKVVDGVNKKKLKTEDRKVIKFKYIHMKDMSVLYTMNFRLVNDDGKSLNKISRKEEEIIENEITSTADYINDKFDTHVYGHKIEGNKLIFSFSGTEKSYNKEKKDLGSIIVTTFNDSSLVGTNDRDIRIVLISDDKKVDKKVDKKDTTSITKKDKKVLENVLLDLPLDNNKVIQSIEIKPNKPKKEYQIVTIKIRVT